MTELISPNMLKTYQSCPKKFFLKYRKGLNMPANNDIFSAGKNIHALASYYLKKENIDNLESALEENEKLIWKYLKTSEYFNYKVICTEYNISVKIDNNFFGGRLDALMENKGKLYILDYKTGSAPKDAKFDFQTIIYLLAVKSAYQTTNITFIYIDLKNKSEVKVDLSDDLALEYELKLKEISRKIEHSIFNATQIGCKNCEYRIICYDKKISN